VLPAAFTGSVASTGARLGAFTLDILAVLMVSAAVTVLAKSALFGGLAFVEITLGLLVLESRTGLTVGNALLRLRASRADAPFSPGIGRSFVRLLITGVGFLVLLVGAWIVVASSAWDSSKLGRSWADRAAGTVVISVPQRAVGRARFAVPASPASAPHAYTLQQQVEAVVLAAPQVVNTAARTTEVDEDSASASRTGIPAAVFAASAIPVVEQPSRLNRTEPPASVMAESSAGTVLLIFDTGQREQFSTPVAVNLGRNPVATEPGDALVVVTDPESTVSKTHLRLEHSRGRTWVTDGGSTNGTDLLSDDGDVTRLAVGERVLVDEGDRIRIGNRTFTISPLLGGEKA